MGGFPLIFSHRGIIRANPQHPRHPRSIPPDYGRKFYAWWHSYQIDGRGCPMLTKLIVRNFKRFKDVEIELADPVIFIGPNNSGKTSALQVLALWENGIIMWWHGVPV